MTERIHLSSPQRGNPSGSLRAGPAGPLGRALAVIVGGMILVAGLFVSALVFSVLIAVGIVAGGWFWWKTRDLRRQLRERMAQMQRMDAGPPPGDPGRDPSGQVLDGDFIREADRHDLAGSGHATRDGTTRRPG